MWELRITPVDYWERHPNEMFADANDPEISILYFDKLSSVFEFVGGKLKRERCGYSGTKDGNDYCAMKI